MPTRTASASVNLEPEALDTLLAYHERSIVAIKTVQQLLTTLNGHADWVSLLTAELPVQTRTSTRTVTRKSLTKKARHRMAIRRKLGQFSTTTPRPGHGHGLGPLVTAGYLTKKRNGYLRTDKPYA